MGLPVILLITLPTDYTKQMFLLQEMLTIGKALAILYPSLVVLSPILSWEDIGLLVCSPQFTYW
jgi:hypothetical protein